MTELHLLHIISKDILEKTKYYCDGKVNDLSIIPLQDETNNNVKMGGSDFSKHKIISSFGEGQVDIAINEKNSVFSHSMDEAWAFIDNPEDIKQKSFFRYENKDTSIEPAEPEFKYNISVNNRSFQINITTDSQNLSDTIFVNNKKIKKEENCWSYYCTEKDQFKNIEIFYIFSNYLKIENNRIAFYSKKIDEPLMGGVQICNGEISFVYNFNPDDISKTPIVDNTFIVNKDCPLANMISFEMKPCLNFIRKRFAERKFTLYFLVGTYNNQNYLIGTFTKKEKWEDIEAKYGTSKVKIKSSLSNQSLKTRQPFKILEKIDSKENKGLWRILADMIIRKPLKKKYIHKKNDVFLFKAKKQEAIRDICIEKDAWGILKIDNSNIQIPSDNYIGHNFFVMRADELGAGGYGHYDEEGIVVVNQELIQDPSMIDQEDRKREINSLQIEKLKKIRENGSSKALFKMLVNFSDSKDIAGKFFDKDKLYRSLDSDIFNVVLTKVYQEVFPVEQKTCFTLVSWGNLLFEYDIYIEINDDALSVNYIKEYQKNETPPVVYLRKKTRKIVIKRGDELIRTEFIPFGVEAKIPIDQEQLIEEKVSSNIVISNFEDFYEKENEEQVSQINVFQDFAINIKGFQESSFDQNRYNVNISLVDAVQVINGYLIKKD